MSLVEKALKKMQSAQESSQATVEPIRPDVLLGASAAPPRNKTLAVDHAALRSMGLLPPDGHERRTSSEYRHIKRPLLASAFGKGVAAVPKGRLIMLASALPGEGKTFTSVNLAMSMALEKDITVVLADADVAKPHISRAFGVADEPGLLDVLRDESRDIESAIIPTSVRGLSILPAGRQMETATELLASERMETVLARLHARDEKRIILFDSPPLLLTSESRVLAGVVGQVVIVVRAETTLRQAVYDALESVGQGKEIRLVLNQSESKAADLYYGYGEYGDQPSAETR